MPGEVLRDAIRYWELRRVWYNVALSVLCVAWVVSTWPHFRPAFVLQSVPKVLGLAALANVCYSAAYLVDVPLQQSSLAVVWRQWRWALWLVGTLFAVAFAHYWIGDEIYPYVGPA